MSHPRLWNHVAGMLLAAGLLVALGARAEEFLSTAADVPLMPGLSEVRDVGVIFDKPGGRIVEAYAVGPVASAGVEQFYGETLPQLGWQRTGRLRFEREEERLEIGFGGQDGSLTVRFDITPR